MVGTNAGDASEPDGRHVCVPSRALKASRPWVALTAYITRRDQFPAMNSKGWQRMSSLNPKPKLLDARRMGDMTLELCIELCESAQYADCVVIAPKPSKTLTIH